MAKLINTEEIIENGVEYIKEYYDSGATVKKLKPQPLPDDYTPPQPEPTQLDIIQENQTTIMLALADLYESNLI